MKTKSTPRSKSATTSKKLAEPASANGSLAASSDVLTLSEAAAFLRVTEDEVRKLATSGQIPGKKIGSDWRTLKSALCDWLSKPEPSTEPADWRESNQRLKELIGVWKNDETVPELVEEIYKERKRHLVGEIQD